MKGSHSPKLSDTNMRKEDRILANRYQVKKKLGSGSHGTVYLVSDLKNSKELNVVKEIYIGDLQPDETVGAVNEARLLCKLNHPGIVKFLDSFIDGNFFCIVTEFCEGGDLDILLHSYRKSGKELEKNELLNWFIQLLLAVQYMHQRNVLHRDLKSKNIFLKKNKIKIGDFGISRILEGNLDKATTFTGTPYYMAPEVLNQDGYNSKSDIWSLGVVLYQMCQLEQAFQGKSLPEVMMKITKADMPMLSQKFDKGLRNIYSSMLCRDPSKRASSTEILNRQYVMNYMDKLKMNIDSKNSSCNQVEVKMQTNEIAEILQLPKKKNILDKSSNIIFSKSESLSETDKLRQRKRLKADIEAEKLKKITASVYEESRQQYSSLRHRQSIVAVPFSNNESEFGYPKHCIDDRDNGLCQKEYDKYLSDEDENTLVENNDQINVFLDKWTQYTDTIFYDEPHEFDNDVEEPIEKGVSSNNLLHEKLTYTHCFGDESVDAPSHDISSKLVENKLTYTHCFGEDETKDNDALPGYSADNILRDSGYSSNTNETQSTIIPDDEMTADTFYLTFNDFEDDSGDSEGSELEEFANCLEHALELSENEEDETIVNKSPHRSPDQLAIKQQKMVSLRKECIKLLGEDGFARVYNFLNKARFESQTSMSEPAIMKKLRKLVNNPRDCFLVEQLLFLEKQNQIQCK